MKILKLDDMVGHWFVGMFEPSAYQANFEVCYKKHSKGEYWQEHYHKVATEINLLIKGKMRINGIEVNSGEIFIIEPYYVSFPEFLEDCELVIVKTVSSPKDKYLI